IIQDFIIQTTKNPGSRNQIFCSLYDEILNYDISDFDLRDRTLALRSAKRETTWPSRPDFFPIGGGNVLYLPCHEVACCCRKKLKNSKIFNFLRQNLKNAAASKCNF